MQNKNMSVFYDPYRERNPFKRVKRFFRHCKWAYQRAVYGYCDRDTWDIGPWFLGVMPGMLDQFADNLHSYPVVRNPESIGNPEVKAVIVDNEKQADFWKTTLKNMAGMFREADEETCCRMNQFEDEWEGMYKEFEQKYGLFGEKLEQEAIKNKEPSIRMHVPSEMTDEWKQITDRFLKEEADIDKYRKQCFNMAMQDFQKWFWDLWD